MVMMKQRIAGFHSKISSMLNRFYNSTSILTGFSEIVHKIGLGLPLDLSDLHYSIRLGTIAELYRTYAIIFNVLCYCFL